MAELADHVVMDYPVPILARPPTSRTVKGIARKPSAALLAVIKAQGNASPSNGKAAKAE